MASNRSLVTTYADDVKLWRTGGDWAGLAAILLAYLIVPHVVTSDFWLGILNYAGILAIGAIGLNLLTGYTGQASLGHAFFLGVGAYTAGYFGGQYTQSKEFSFFGLFSVEGPLPMPVWIVLAAVIGALIGALVGPFALRLRGNYLAVVSVGLVFVGTHIFKSWSSVTGGRSNLQVDPVSTIGSLDFRDLNVLGSQYTKQQGMFFLIWFMVLIVALLSKNIVRSRPGRAMQAVRDRDIAAEIIGVDTARYKIQAFAVSSAIAAVAGALMMNYEQFASPDRWDLFLSIQFVAIIIVGGVGTIFGSIIGAVTIWATPEVVKWLTGSGYMPYIYETGGSINRSDSAMVPVLLGTIGLGLVAVAVWRWTAGSRSVAIATGVLGLVALLGIPFGDTAIIGVDQFNGILFGALIVLFLLVEPRGLAAVWIRIKNSFRMWPFSY
ncbi:MAG: branched-chain amino acid ABC transporter permease [Actinobacteria bacterium]|nr:branched-chain amino acid ABC transporter permease [Actinomycetota bacterium]MCB9388134.1 branched-chain amino acid ABC transporter permease [Acidimicrobiia bacterium]